MISESDRKDIPKEAIQAFQTVDSFLDSSVVGVYLFGSAIVGGLRPNSDVDVLVIVGEDLSDDVRKELVYGEWLRDEFEQGRIPVPAHDTDLAIGLKKVRESSIALAGPDASEILDPVPMKYLPKTWPRNGR